MRAPTGQVPQRILSGFRRGAAPVGGSREGGRWVSEQKWQCHHTSSMAKAMSEQPHPVDKPQHREAESRVGGTVNAEHIARKLVQAACLST